MASTTPFFKAFGPLLFGRPARHATAMLKSGVHSLTDFYDLFGHLFSEKLLECEEAGPNSRERVFIPQVTFWAFVAQVLSPDSPCRETVRRVEAWRRRTSKEAFAGMSSSTSAYCQARARLDLQTLELIASQLAWNLEKRVLESERALGKRPVKIIDGTTLSMPDTAANQAFWPQSASQKPGLGFPCMKLVGLFSLASGALLESASGSLREHETTLFRRLWEKLRGGDVLLADRGFCSYVNLAALARRGVDSLMRLHAMRPVDFRRGQRLGHDDRLVSWQKPLLRPEGWSEEEFGPLPETLSVRLIRLQVAAQGFRTKTVVLATTLTDPVAHPADVLRALYAERWRVEGHFFQIKELLALDVLRRKSPALIERDAAIHKIAYNLVRALMQRSAHSHGVELGRISFKGSLDALRHWSASIAAAGSQPKKQEALIDQLLAAIARDPVPERPGRSEPRAKKRRPKNYHLLTRPRHKMGNLPHRNKPGKKQPKTRLS
jgi:hypothetical protein